MKRTFIPAVTVFVAVVLSASPGSTEISFDGHVIGGGVNAWYAIATDLDGDGDLDVVASGRLGNRVLWWENDGRQNFSKHVVSDTLGGASDVRAVDFDLDGDLDLVTAAQFGEQVAWWENYRRRPPPRRATGRRSPSRPGGDLR